MPTSATASLGPGPVLRRRPHPAPLHAGGRKGTWYKGTANAIYQNINFLETYDPEYVLILSGDHVYKMDYTQLLRRHKEADAACTIAVLEVPMEEASRFGIMNVDENDDIYEFEEKPKHPKSNLASMGIYIFTWSKLREYLIADEADEKSSNDFGKNIIPAMLDAGEKMTAYRFQATGRTWAPSTPCGTPIWICFPPTTASTLRH